MFTTLYLNQKIQLIFFLVVALVPKTHAQNNRLNTNETIGWYGLFGTIKTSEKTGIYAEYQWRRDKLITDPAQHLVRVGINYSLTPRVLFRVGYGWIKTYPYGEIPINAFGRSYLEHRFFESVQLTHKEGRFDFIHRFMLEQRWIGRYTVADNPHADEYPRFNRLRYMVRLQMPLKGHELKDKTPYVALFDEVAIGFGKNVNANIFDQNRLSFLVGYRINATWRVEGGYINQVLQFGRLINGQNVFQHNNGILLYVFVNLDATRKETE